LQDSSDNPIQETGEAKHKALVVVPFPGMQEELCKLRIMGAFDDLLLNVRSYRDAPLLFT
jgi:hypothetical protein